MTEYIIIVAVVALAALAAFKLFGGNVSNSIKSAGKTLQSETGSEKDESQ